MNNYKAIDWNNISDQIDVATWEKLTEQFWLDTRIPIANDLKDWRSLDDDHRWLVSHVFGGLTLLDTLQSQDGMAALRKDVRTQQETAVLNNIQFMESVHAKSYSSIFSTLNTPDEIKEIFHWSDTEEYLQNKAKRIYEMYHDDESPLKKKVSSVFLESFLFYSGFFTPLWYLGHNKLPNVAEIIKLILRDESVHGTYIGYKFQIGFNELDKAEQNRLKDWIYNFLYALFENEIKYTHLLYDQVGWTKKVINFLEYNANKALMNLGLSPLFSTTAKDVDPIVMNGISTTTANHDFFSQVGNGYRIGAVQPMRNSDYKIGFTTDRGKFWYPDDKNGGDNLKVSKKNLKKGTHDYTKHVANDTKSKMNKRNQDEKNVITKMKKD